MQAAGGYEWDDAMDARCLNEYGFSFHDVVGIFDSDEFEYLLLGPFAVEAEARWVAIGALPWGSVFAVVYTDRPPNRRIIWVRPARRSERAAFYDHNDWGQP
jgi:uncharacterized DUF497 family protein